MEILWGMTSCRCHDTRCGKQAKQIKYDGWFVVGFYLMPVELHLHAIGHHHQRKQCSKHTTKLRRPLRLFLVFLSPITATRKRDPLPSFSKILYNAVPVIADLNNVFPVTGGTFFQPLVLGPTVDTYVESH